MASPPAARADEPAIASKLADDGAFASGPYRAADRGSFVAVASTLDGSRSTGRASVDALGEAHLVGPLRLTARVANVFGERARPGIGAAVRLLDERGSGIAASVYLQYKTEGFAEPEGELEGAIAIAKRLGSVRTSLAIAYGQDPEGNERDGELAIAAQLAVRTDLFAGVVARYRDALGSTKEAIARDGFGGATATLALAGHLAVSVAAGIAFVDARDMPRGVGPAVTITLGAGF